MADAVLICNGFKGFLPDTSANDKITPILCFISIVQTLAGNSGYVEQALRQA
jgi:hypothetical protein